MSHGYAVCVTFGLKAVHMDAFVARVAQQAKDSLSEPGCRVFDVWTGGAQSQRVFLYEVYDDRAAFDAHLETPHFHSFDAAVADMVISKDVSTWETQH